MMNDEPTFSEEPNIPTISKSEPCIGVGRSSGAVGISSSNGGGLRLSRRRPPMMSTEDIEKGSNDGLPRPSSAEAPQAKFRGWIPHSQFASPQQHQAACFDPRSIRVMSYNILASRYVSTDKYRFCPTWALSEPHRCANMLVEIAAAKPDILFFQELSSDLHRSSYFGEKLRTEFDYDSFHVPISNKQGQSHAQATSGSGVADSMGSNGSYTMENQAPRVVRASGGGGATASSNPLGGSMECGGAAAALNSNEFQTAGGIPLAEDCTRPEFEGVALFYNKSRYEPQEHLPVKFNVLAQNDGKLATAERKRLIISSHNVAIISVLLDKISGDAIICAGTHAYWDWSRPECQQWQMARLLQEVEVLEAAYQDLGHTTRVIIGGDFNSEPNQPSVQYALHNEMPSSFPATVTFPGYTESRHELTLQNTYSEYCHVNPTHITSTGPSFQGVIDYLFTDTTLQVVAVAALAGAVEMPSVTIPSDHYPIAVVLLPMREAL